MNKLYLPRKTSVFIVIGLCVFSASIPSTQSTPTWNSSYNDSSIGLPAAITVAQAKLRSLDRTDVTIKDSIAINNDKEVLLCYMFNLNPEGYLIVSGYTNLPPVIAYSFSSNSHYDNTNYNVLYEMLKHDISLRLQNIPYLPAITIERRHQAWDVLLNDKPQQNFDTGFEQWPPEGTTATGGWLETNWEQTAPYNNFCPLDKADEGRSVAGCPAVAMAMILNYHQTTNNVMFNDSDDYHHTYGGNNYWIDNDHESYDFPSYPELNGYLTTLVSHYQNHTPVTDTDAAALTFACGVAASQVYGAQGSGTFGVNQAYTAYMKFHCLTCELLKSPEVNIYGRLAKNMIDALPAHLAVVDETWSSGHNLVVDGYNTDDFYHLNFGWGGTYNGWYLLPDEIPYGLTVLEGVIVDIIDDQAGPRVRCNGTLQFTNITPGATLTGSFTVENAGAANSSLNWEITITPDWGTWTFSPSSGTALTPEQGPMNINVSVVAPSRKNKDYSGYIKVANTENPDDCYIIQISLTTPYRPHTPLLDILQALMQRFPHAFPLLRYVLNH